ncbi:MAG TPA: sensor histidine kinase, partial [Candidatus Saccharimonadales bacterium]|nr:sensor histidine kinase [Candidatus Saccharimonadales bacterium]
VLLEITRHDVRGGSGNGTGAVEMVDIVHEAKNHVAKMAKQRQVSLSVDTVPVKAKGDKASLVELLVIFLDNAIKYSPEGSKVHIGLSRQGHYAVVTVYDHGIGIGKEDLEHIFERFYRADQSRSKEKTTGFGLGLSLAKLIADRHDGRIVIESDVGKGTLVRLQLPLATDLKPTQSKR